jgi:hypothetical protein
LYLTGVVSHWLTHSAFTTTNSTGVDEVDSV